MKMSTQEMIQEQQARGGVVLFDGVCNLCNGLVIFIIKRDPNAYFKFVPLQSPVGKAVLTSYHLPPYDADTVILTEGDRVYSRSTAALRIFRRLHKAWPLLYTFIIIPRPLRDLVYKWVAKHRYSWFGKKDSCMVPEPGYAGRFLTGELDFKLRIK